jgi:hypothetical protein
MEMESVHDLQREDPIDIYCLHYVFLPYINYTLGHYVDAWNYHGMSNTGLGGLSPVQMWYRGKYNRIAITVGFVGPNWAKLVFFRPHGRVQQRF